jgi:two-component system, cell cycle response regulator
MGEKRTVNGPRPASSAGEGPASEGREIALPVELSHGLNNALTSLLSNLDLAAESTPPATAAGRSVREARDLAVRIRAVIEQIAVTSPPSQARSTAPSAPAPSRVRVLVVDDEAAIGTAVRRTLADCHVVPVTDAAEALALVAGGDAFDLILCDLMMPQMTGMDLYEEIVRIAPQQARCMVFMTAGATTTRAREFIATVPRAVVSKPLDARELRALVGQRTAMLSQGPGSVLVVDDDDASRKLVMRWLTSAKLTCVEQPSGQAALEWLAADPDRVDAVVLDVNMPGLDGFEVVSRLKADPATAPIQVLMVTAHATREADVTQGMEAGAVDYLAKPFSGPVLVAKVRAACERRRAERGLRAKLQSAEEHATTDALTGLLNRRAFDDALARASASAVRTTEPLALAMLDLDHFKQINDTFGHPGGDQLLAHFADAVRRVVRGGDLAFRYGGEEFAVILPRCGADDAARVVSRIQRDLRERPVSLAGRSPVVARFSAGIASAQASNRYRVDELVARADAALYRAKSGGRDRIEME